MSANERTVVLGLMSYIDENGAHKVANAGAVVKVHPDKLERFDRLNVLAKAAPAPEAAPAEAEPEGEDHTADSGDDKSSRGRRAPRKDA